MDQMVVSRRSPETTILGGASTSSSSANHRLLVPPTGGGVGASIVSIVTPSLSLFVFPARVPRLVGIARPCIATITFSLCPFLWYFCGRASATTQISCLTIVSGGFDADDNQSDEEAPELQFLVSMKTAGEAQFLVGHLPVSINCSNSRLVFNASYECSFVPQDHSTAQGTVRVLTCSA